MNAPQFVNLAPFGAGVFTMNGQGQVQAGGLDPLYRLVDASHPAVAGSTTAQIYATGLGAVTN